MVWCGIIDTNIIGPYFFPGAVNNETYLDMMFNFLLPKLHGLGYDSKEICYMHDGAPAHYTRNVRDSLDDNFESWIGRGDGAKRLLAWPPRSPDLNMLDFYLWGYLVHKVNLTTNDTVEQIKTKLVDEIHNITPDTLRQVQKNLIKRLRTCIEVNGGIFEHIIKRRQ